MTHDPNTKALILLTPGKDDPDSFVLYREGHPIADVAPCLVFSVKEAINLAEELQRFTRGVSEHTRVLIPDMDKPKKITRPLR